MHWRVFAVAAVAACGVIGFALAALSPRFADKSPSAVPVDIE
jgi:hypothetical protein